MKRILIFVLLAFIMVLLAYDLFSKDKKNSALRSETSFQENQLYPDLNENDTLLIKHGFVVAFNKKYKIPDWAAYMFTKAEAENSIAERADRFIPEKCIETANDNDYKKSGYDKGHIVPAKDMSYSEITMKESFYYSNVCPQEPNFNRGRWKQLEEKVRNWAIDDDSVFVVTGVYYTPDDKRIGKNHIVVPSYFYKAIIDITEPQEKGIAFLFKNGKTSEPLSSFVITIDSLEHFTKLDYFKGLPENLENKVESKVEIGKWNLPNK